MTRRDNDAIVQSIEGATSMMKIRGIIVAAVLQSLVIAATAQTNSPLIGTWVHKSETGYCGTSTYKITAVEPNGTVRGTFTCAKTNWTPVLGDKVGRDNVKGTFDGKRFIMVNADGGGNDLVLNGTKLEGTGQVSAARPKNPVVYVKE
jgi:hypothetical protein